MQQICKSDTMFRRVQKKQPSSCVPISCNISTEGRHRRIVVWRVWGVRVYISFFNRIVSPRRPEITFNHIIHNTHRVLQRACCIYLYIADAYLYFLSNVIPVHHYKMYPLSNSTESSRFIAHTTDEL